MANTAPGTEKRSPPLGEPPQEKRAAVAAPVKKLTYKNNNSSVGREKGVSKGGRERVKVAEAILKCQMCGREQKLTFRFGRPPEWHKCTWCGELQPIDGYHVTAYGLGLPRVLAPHEVKAKEVDLERLKEVNDGKVSRSL